jgi:hypothetical protein
LKSVKVLIIKEREIFMVKIFVDDLRECPEGFLCARTFKEAKELLLEYKGNISFATFDNDLGGGKNEYGLHLFPFMKENEIFPPKINCHTGGDPRRMVMVANYYLPEDIIITTNQDYPYEDEIELDVESKKLGKH